MNSNPKFSIIQRYANHTQKQKNLSTQDISELCCQKISEFELQKNPVHYTLIYEWLHQVDPYFTDEVDKAIRLREYDDKKADELFLKLIAQMLYKSIPAEQANYLLNDLLTNLDAWIIKTADKHNQLHSQIGQAEEVESGQQALEVLKAFIPTVKQVLSDTQELQKKVKDSAHKIRLLKEELERTTTIAKTDELTNIPNRRGFNEIIQRLTVEAQQQQSTFAIILLDIDHFKNVNDTYGHLIGDSVLRYIAKLLGQETKGQDSIARYGGEEFAVLLPNTNYDGAMQLANNLRHKIASRSLTIKTSHNQKLQISVSSGVAMYQMGEDVEQLIKRADQCLYQAKTKGRNQVCGEADL